MAHLADDCFAFDKPMRVLSTRGADGTPEAHKFFRDVAALLTSLTESNGLVALPDDAISVTQGDVLAYDPHASFW